MTTPQRIGPYEVVTVLGAGAMGTVYRARQPRLKRDVALKVLSRSREQKPDAERRFLREMKIAAELSHPNLVKVFDAGSSDAGLYLAMELVEGDTLYAWMKREPGGLPWRTALALAARLADGIAYLHERGIVHRDIKPANVIVTRGGAPVLLDFGVARHDGATLLTQEGEVLGTLLYMPPETFIGEGATPAGDMWSLGCILREMLGAPLPWRAGTMTEVVRAIANAEIPPVHESVGEVPPEVSMLVAELLERDVARRLDRAGEVRNRCEKLLESSSVVRMSTPAARRPSSAPPVRRHLSAAMGAVATVIVLFAAASLRTQRQPDVPSPTTVPSRAPSPSPAASGPRFARQLEALRAGGPPAERAGEELVRALPADVSRAVAGFAVRQVAASPRAGVPWLELGIVLEKGRASEDARGAYAVALERLERAELEDASRPAWQALARALFLVRRASLVEEWMRRVCRAGIRGRAAWLGLRDALQRDDAALYERACRAALDDGACGTSAADALGGHLHHFLGEVDAARTVWTRALAKDPAAERIREALAMLELGQGELAAAERWLAPVAPHDRHRVMFEYVRGPVAVPPRFAGPESRRDDLFRMELFRVLELGDTAGAQRLLDGRPTFASDQAGRVAPELLAAGCSAPWLEDAARAELFARPPSWPAWSAAAGVLTTAPGHARMEAWLAEARAGDEGVARAARALWLARRGELSGALDVLEKPAPGAARTPALAVCETVARALTSPSEELKARARGLARSAEVDGPPAAAALAAALARGEVAGAAAAALKVADREPEEPGWPLIAWMLVEKTDRAHRERLAARVRAVVRLRSSGRWALRESTR